MIAIPAKPPAKRADGTERNGTHARAQFARIRPETSVPNPVRRNGTERHCFVIRRSMLSSPLGPISRRAEIRLALYLEHLSGTSHSYMVHADSGYVRQWDAECSLSLSFL